MSLSNEQILALLQKSAPAITTPQVGPLRRFNDTKRCASRGCATGTNLSVQGIPRCTVHALEEMNLMLVSAGYRGVSSRVKTNPTKIPDGRIVTASVRAFCDVGWALGKFECIHGNSLEKECDACPGT